MIYVPIKHLKPGMIVAQDVNYGTSFFSLIVSGQSLTAYSIARLEKYNIPGVYIQSKLLEGVDVEEFIDSRLKQKTIVELKKVYDGYTNQKVISHSTLKQFSQLAENLIEHALSKEECLVNIIDLKDYDTYTYTHSMYVGILSTLVGIKKGFSHSMLTELTMCGLLHDTGKLDIPLEIINKPSKLTKDEFDIMKTHPDNAVLRLKQYRSVFPSVLEGIRSHHERYDGTGYPRGLAGEKIPLYGRILAIADVYDALTSQRSYRKALSSSEAIEYIMGCSGTHFDHELLQIFLRVVAAYPVGTIVKLSNGFMGVVVGNSPENCLRPKVRLFEPSTKFGEEIDLFTDRSYLSVTIVGTVEDEIKLPDKIFM